MAEVPVAIARRHGASTPARIGLGRTGQSLTTAALLDFDFAHARARDAVHAKLDAAELRKTLVGLDVVEVRSRAADRATYLQRPDLGRLLDEDDRRLLARAKAELAIVIGDGLSATAVARHAGPLLAALLPRLPGWSMAPLVVAHQARVALGDEVGDAVGADVVVMLIGERPGLTAQDSLGAYVTWAPRRGRRDSERNCVSNIRPPHGLDYAGAAWQIARILHAARTLRLTGIDLGEDRIGSIGLE